MMMRAFGHAVLAAAASLLVVACGAGTEPDDLANGEATQTGLDVTIHDGEFATIKQFTTPSGVSVWLVEERFIPILSLRMAWEQGTSSDPDGFEGLTNSVTYMMNEGAGDMDSQAFFQRMEELNMSFGCSAGQTSTFCNASMLTENADESFALISEAYAEPRFDEVPFERFRRENEVSLNTRETNANYLASRAQIEALYPDHPFARQLTAESLSALTAEAAKAHKSQVMTREGLIVTAVGAISPEELAPLIDEMAAGLSDATIETPLEPVALNEASEAPLTVSLPQPQSLVQFVGPAVARDHPDYYPLIVMNHIFGGGGNFSARLMSSLRVEKGLTYSIRTSVSPGEYLQLFSGGGQTKNESAGEFIEGIKEEMRLMATEGATVAEVEKSVAYLTGSYPLSFDSNAKIAGNMMSVRIEGLPVDYFDTRNDQISAVTLEDVNRVAATYLSPERFTFFVVGEPEGLEG
ncbi:MAG: pitrilysin family protein [Pseudomonadota bacterium]